MVMSCRLGSTCLIVWYIYSSKLRYRVTASLGRLENVSVSEYIKTTEVRLNPLYVELWNVFSFNPENTRDFNIEWGNLVQWIFKYVS